MEWLTQLEAPIIQFINGDMANPILDSFFNFLSSVHYMPAVRFVLLPVLIAALAYRWRWLAVRGGLAVILAAGLSDMFSHRVLKPLVARERPYLQPHLNVTKRQEWPARSYSFPSNHAVNTFAGAAMIAWYVPPAAPYVYVYASLVAISRVYLGVHFLSDVMAGALVGLLVARLLQMIGLRLQRRLGWGTSSGSGGSSGGGEGS